MNFLLNFFKTGSQKRFQPRRLLRRYRWYRAIALVLIAWLLSSFLWTGSSTVPTGDYYAKININMSPSASLDWLSALQDAAFDARCRGILLFFDQAIGDGNALGQTEQALSLIGQARKYKPVVGYLYGYTLGSNYVVASASQVLVAQNTASIAGVGIRTAQFNYDKLLDMVGVEVINKGFGKLKTSPKPGDQHHDAFVAHREQITDQLQQWMISVVQRNRGLDAEQTKLIDRGQWYLGMRACHYGLCDLNGDERDAIAQLAQLSKSGALPVFNAQHSQMNVFQNATAWLKGKHQARFSKGLSGLLGRWVLDVVEQVNRNNLGFWHE